MITQLIIKITLALRTKNVNVTFIIMDNFMWYAP